MAHDISYYRQQLNKVHTSITAQENKNKTLKKEYEKLDSAYTQLKTKGVEERAKQLEKDMSKNKPGKDLAWRGKRKKDFDDFIGKDPRESAVQFRKDTEKYVKAVEKARKAKKKEWDKGVKELTGWFGMYKQRDKIKKKILNLGNK